MKDGEQVPEGYTVVKVLESEWRPSASGEDKVKWTYVELGEIELYGESETVEVAEDGFPV